MLRSLNSNAFVEIIKYQKILRRFLTIFQIYFLTQILITCAFSFIILGQLKSQQDLLSQKTLKRIFVFLPLALRKWETRRVLNN
jgi:hypothetical protein